MNGSGKTTFIKLLCRLYDPTEGEILLNNVDIRKYDYKEYMSIFSVVFQDFKLYEDAGKSGKSGKSIEGRVSFNQIWILLIMKISIISEEKRRKTDSENHLYKTYDKIDEVEELLV